MALKIVIDMSLSPAWTSVLQSAGWPAIHWSAVGDPRATDHQIMAWAAVNGHVVFTHDLDFGTILALTHKAGPSVLQVRAQDILPDHLADLVIAALRHHAGELASGALVVVEESRHRVRILPI